MNYIWFKRTGFFFIPVNFMGIAVTVIAVAFLIPVYTAIIQREQSAGDGLYPVFVYTTCTAFWWKWIAEKTS